MLLEYENLVEADFCLRHDYGFDACLGDMVYGVLFEYISFLCKGFK